MRHAKLLGGERRMRVVTPREPGKGGTNTELDGENQLSLAKGRIS